MPPRQHRARAIVFPVNVTLLAQASIVGEGLVGVNIFEPLAPEGEKFPGMLETVDPDHFPRTLEAGAISKPMYYRADLRPDIEVFIPSGFYEDGALEQMNIRGRKKPKGEIAFAEDIGGAIYAAVQFRSHDDSDISHEDFFDNTIEYYLHIYATEKKWDYLPDGTQLDTMFDTETDFDVIGEVRYFDDVPVKYLGKIPITKSEIATLNACIYKDKPIADFDFELSNDPIKIKEGLKRIMLGDRDFIKEHLLPWPGREIHRTEWVSGIDTNIAKYFIDHFNQKWKKIHKAEKLKVRGIGSGWHYESNRHALAARGIRTR